MDSVFRLRAGQMLAGVLANLAALERAYSRASTDVPDEEARWSAEGLCVDAGSDREVVEALIGDYHPDPARAVRMAGAPGHAVADVLVKVRLKTDAPVHAIVDAVALEARAAALWRALEAVARRGGDVMLAETAAIRAETHEARHKQHHARVVEAAFWAPVPGEDATKRAVVG